MSGTVEETHPHRRVGVGGGIRSRSWLEWILVAVISLVGAVITWRRVPADHRDRVWAEDANIFLDEALDYGAWSVIFEGYAGYQHFVPRVIVALIMPVLDLAAYPVLIFGICAALTGLTAGAVFWLSRDIVPWLPARITLGLTTVILPLATQETVGNLADLHAYAMWLTPWLLLYRPRNWWTSAGWALVTFAVVMTEIQAVFFVFLILFRLRRRDRLMWPVFGAFAAGAVIQLITSILVRRETGEGPLTIASTVLGWVINTVMPLVTGDPQTIRAWVIESGWLVGVLILIPLIVASVVALIWGTGAQRLLVVSLLLASAAIYTGSAWANSGFWFAYAEEDLADLGVRLAINIRYGVASGMMLVAVLPIAAAIIRRRWGRSVILTICAWLVCAATVAVLAYGSTTAISIRGQVDRWSPSVAEAAATCASDGGPATVTLPVAPDRSIDLRCDDVVELSRP